MNWPRAGKRGILIPAPNGRAMLIVEVGTMNWKYEEKAEQGRANVAEQIEARGRVESSSDRELLERLCALTVGGWLVCEGWNVYIEMVELFNAAWLRGLLGPLAPEWEVVVISPSGDLCFFDRMSWHREPMA